MDTNVLFGAIGAVMSVGGVGAYVVRLEGRLNNHQTLFAEREKQDELRQELLMQRLNDISKKQDRTEQKLDNYFNAHNGHKG